MAHFSCADYEGVEDQGILAGLLCNEDVASFEKIESLRFAGENENEFAISFLDYDANDDFEAVGSWTSVGDVSNKFPGNMRIWTDTTGELQSAFAAELASGSRGTVYFDLNHHGVPLSGQITFVHQEDTSNCEAAPSQDTCHYQEIILKGVEEGGENNPPPAIHLYIYASEKDDPNFFAIEGSVRLTEAATQAIWGDDEVTQAIPELLDTRDIYFRTVRSGDELWGSFDFKNADDETLDLSVSPINGVTIDFGPILRDGTSGEDYAGICQNFGSDEQVECSNIDGSSYATLWQSDEATNGPTEYQIPVPMDDVPVKGLILQ